jgi:hypothetical protein
LILTRWKKSWSLRNRTSKPFPMTAGMKQTYETGMKVAYDAASKRVVVSFRARISVLPGTYESEAAGVEAGESFCRKHGWRPSAPTRPKTPFQSLS